jgi:hypothetical protein
MSLPSKYSWRFYLLVAHLVDEHGHTACNRTLPRTDPILDDSLYKHLKCKTCSLYEQKQEGSGSK